MTGEAFKGAAGYHARVFVGVARGWVACDAASVYAEDVRDHFDEIRDLDGHSVPERVYDDLLRLIDRVQAVG